MTDCRCLDVETEVRRLSDHLSAHSQGGTACRCCQTLIDEVVHLAYVKGRTAGILETSGLLREAHRHGRAAGIREAALARPESPARGASDVH
jgi:hypothetical protein